MGPRHAIASLLLATLATIIACGDDGGSGGAGAGAGSGGGGAPATTSGGLAAGSTSTGATSTGTTSASTAGASTSSTSTGSTSTGAGGGDLALPPADAGLDYQLGGPYAPPPGVDIVVRDRRAPSAGALYDVCYVNGYQSQPDEESFWLDEHPDLVLRDDDGDPVIDPDWDEMLLDVTTAAKRDALATIVGGWIDGCAADGFEAVEIDNLDTYSRSGGRITEDDAVAFMQLLSARAHGAGLAIAQKNSAEIVGRRDEMGTDFAVAEECNVYDECDVYVGAYGDAVLVVEYTRDAFETGCASYPGLSIVLRDLDLATPSEAGYVHDGC